MRLATSVYNPSGKKTQPPRTYSHKKKSSHVSGKKQCTLPAIVPVPVSKVTTQRSPPTAAASSSHDAIRGGSKVKEKGHTLAQLQGDECCHTLKTYGAQLFMPSSYCNLQKRFSRISGHINSTGNSDVAAGHFVKSLTQRRDWQVSEGCHLQLLREGYTILKDQLSSQAHDSSSWQEVKEQLDLITVHYSTTKDADAVPNVMAACVAFSQPNTVVYSTTKEWLEMARSEHTRQLQQLELEILKICRENLLPKLSSFQHEDICSFTETKRLLHAVLGLDAKPTISEE